MFVTEGSGVVSRCAGCSIAISVPGVLRYCGCGRGPGQQRCSVRRTSGGNNATKISRVGGGCAHDGVRELDRPEVSVCRSRRQQRSKIVRKSVTFYHMLRAASCPSFSSELPTAKHDLGMLLPGRCTIIIMLVLACASTALPKCTLSCCSLLTRCQIHYDQVASPGVADYCTMHSSMMSLVTMTRE